MNQTLFKFKIRGQWPCHVMRQFGTGSLSETTEFCRACIMLFVIHIMKHCCYTFFLMPARLVHGAAEKVQPWWVTSPPIDILHINANSWSFCYDQCICDASAQLLMWVSVFNSPGCHQMKSCPALSWNRRMRIYWNVSLKCSKRSGCWKKRCGILTWQRTMKILGCF